MERRNLRAEILWIAVIIPLAMYTSATNTTDTAQVLEDENAYAWSAWGSWSACSKTCGGGVAVQSRECLPRAHVPNTTLPTPVVTVRVSRRARSAACWGVAERYHECNTAPCVGGAVDARAEQCAAYDRRPFRGRFYTWVPYVDGDSPCTLNCRPLGMHFYASLALVADGAPCTRPGFRAICVQGACKVALIFGINGACRRQELHNITTKDIENHGKMLLVKIPNTKNKIPRSFTIHGPFYDIVKKYEALRTTNAKNDLFFQNYQKGKCTAQPIGINKFGAMPKEVAKFLELPDADCYTGHSFRRTSATLLADSGADIMTLKRHGGWRSNAVAESYIEDSIQNKANISAKITQAINLKPQTKKFCPEPRPSTSTNDNFSFTCTNEELQCSSVAYQDVSPSPTFTVTQNSENNDIINNNNNNKPTKTITYNFNNCTFSDCFNK